MSSKITNNLAMIFVVAIVVFGVGWSIYDAVFSTTSEKAQRALDKLVEGCERNKARSEVFQAFAREAAAARRAQAVEASKAGDHVSAENNLATAARYESFAKQWDTLTIKDCQLYYNQS